MRRLVVAAAVAASLVLPTTVASGQTAGQTLAHQLIAGAESSLSGGATVAVARALDRGYDLVQIIEGLIGATLVADGTIADEEGVPVEPASDPAGLIVEDGSTGSAGPVGGTARVAGGSIEEIGLEALETGAAKTSKRLDKKHDLGARADVYDASLDVFTMIAVIFLADAGYSTEQIIIDGLLDQGIDIGGGLMGPVEIVIRDREGKIIRPNGIPPRFEDETTAAAVDDLMGDLLDAVSGEDPLAVGDNTYKRQYTLTFDVEFTDDEGATGTITGKVNMGELKDLDGRLAGRGNGTLSLENKIGCSLSELDTTKYPYSVRTPLRMAVYGNGKPGGRATLKMAVEATGAAKVTGDESALCIEVVGDTADFYTQLITFPDLEVLLRAGETANADTANRDEPFTTAVTVTVKKI